MSDTNKQAGYDPKLREAMTEIDEILKRYDIGAFVTLHSKAHTEFKFKIDPTWSMMRFIKEGEVVHIKLHNATNKENTEASVGMIYSIRDLCGMYFMQCDKLADQIEKHCKVIHVPFGSGINNDDRKEPA